MLFGTSILSSQYYCLYYEELSHVAELCRIAQKRLTKRLCNPWDCEKRACDY